ncbi:MAG: glycosyltransferase family A protein [Candidatus Azambacteria bacterium]|nr:glycosyltransferase family A protein [Candidatus Azambacteria bacterium]
MPKVSIIIPTLNRAHLLKFALQSAVRQDFKDLEIIVCDDFSGDNTKEMVESFNNQSIVYVRSEKRLNMTDTFEFALSKSTGEYVTFLTDACYLISGSISFAMAELEKNGVKLAMWGNCVYCYPDWMEKVRGNTLQIPKFSFKTYLIDSKDALKKFYNNMREPVIPKSINSLCHRSVVEKTIKIQGRFFSQPIPDHTSAVSMLANTDRFIFIDRPLFLGSLSSSNIGASQSFNLGEKAQNFLKSFPGKKIDEIVFLGIYTTASLIIKSLEDVKKFYPDCPKINMKNALSEIVDSLVKLQTYGTRVNDYWEILTNYIDKQYGYLKLVILKTKIKSMIKWRAVKIIRSSSYLYKFESLFRGMKILKGDKYGFNNIEECAKIIEKLNNKNNDK